MKLQSVKEKCMGWLDSIPAFNDKGFALAGYVSAGVLAAVVVFFNYEMYTTHDFGIKTQWNMFKSPFLPVLWVYGLVMAIINWGKFTHWSATPVIETRDSSGNLISREKNYDIIETLFGGLIMPILGHFVIEPMIYAAIVYYPMACVFALVASVLPYLITLMTVLLVVGMALSSRLLKGLRYRSIFLIIVAVMSIGGLGWWGYYLEMAKPSHMLEMYDKNNEEPYTEETPKEDNTKQSDEEDFSNIDVNTTEENEFTDSETTEQNMTGFE